MRLFIFASALAAALSVPAHAQQRPQLAVMTFEAREADPQLAASATEAAAQALRDLQTFKVISRAEIAQMLSLDRERTLLAGQCGESSCLTELANAIGARFLVVGSVAGRGPFGLRVQLFDMRKVEVIGDQARAGLRSSTELMEAVPLLAQASVRAILDKQQGHLALVCPENQAKVTIDGRLVGLTPLGAQRVAWGPHRVTVEKEGFVSWARDVQIEKNRTTAETVVLIPAPDFIEAYRRRNGRMRLGAWATTGLAVAAAGTAAWVQFAKVGPTFDRFRPLQSAFQTNRNLPQACADADAALPSDDPLKGRVAAEPLGACREYADTLSKEGEQALWLSRGAAAGALVATGAALYFWLAGDDPGRYDLFQQGPETRGGAPLSLVPLRGGGLATLTLRL